MQVEAGVLVRKAAQSFGSRAALTAASPTAGSTSLTFAEVNERSNRVGSALVDLGVRRGDRVGVLAYNTPEVVADLVRLREAQPGQGRPAQPLRDGRPRMVAQPRGGLGAHLRHPVRRRRRAAPGRAEDRPPLRRDRRRLPRLGHPVRAAGVRRQRRGSLPRCRRGRPVLPAAHLGHHRAPQGVGEDLPVLAGGHQPQPASTSTPSAPASRRSGPTTSTCTSTRSSGRAASRPSTRTSCGAPAPCCWTTRPSTRACCSTRSPASR